jgi:hypothetical protein
MSQATDTILTNRFLLDLSVPDMPAFKALGADPSNILRPADLQKFAASLSPFYSGSQAVIPKNFAMEFAPWKLGSKHWTLAKYNSGLNSVLYNSGFSIATIQDSSAHPFKLALGYRLTIAGKKADILKAAYQKSKALQNLHDTTFQAYVGIRDYWVYQVQRLSRAMAPDDVETYFKSHSDDFYNWLEQYWGQNIDDKALNTFYQAFKNAAQLKSMQDIENLKKFKAGYYPAIIDSIEESMVKSFNDTMWNASRFDLAIAYVGQSQDSLIKNAQFGSFNLWATYALGIGRSSQLLFGTTLVLPRTEQNDTVKTNMAITGNLRFYLGTNSIRGFIETQYKYQNYSGLQRSLLFNLGGNSGSASSSGSSPMRGSITIWEFKNH